MPNGQFKCHWLWGTLSTVNYQSGSKQLISWHAAQIFVSPLRRLWSSVAVCTTVTRNRLIGCMWELVASETHILETKTTYRFFTPHCNRHQSLMQQMSTTAHTHKQAETVLVIQVNTQDWVVLKNLKITERKKERSFVVPLSWRMTGERKGRQEMIEINGVYTMQNGNIEIIYCTKEEAKGKRQWCKIIRFLLIAVPVRSNIIAIMRLQNVSNLIQVLPAMRRHTWGRARHLQSVSHTVRELPKAQECHTRKNSQAHITAMLLLGQLERQCRANEHPLTYSFRALRQIASSPH